MNKGIQSANKYTYDSLDRELISLLRKDGRASLSKLADILKVSRGTVQNRLDRFIVEVVAAGRVRWKVENENNNVLKNHGYHLEHNFGHGQQHLSNLLATMALLAFLMHTALEWIDERYRQLR